MIVWHSFLPIPIVLLTFFLLSCSNVKTIRDIDYSTMYFRSEKPHLLIKLKDDELTDYLGKKTLNHKYTKIEAHRFHTKYGNFQITIINATNPNRNFSYYGDEWNAQNWFKAKIIDTEIINGQKWLKIAKVDEDNWFYAGYFKRKNDYFIFVHHYKHIGQFADEIENYRKSMRISTEQMQWIEKQFDIADKMFEIVE